MTMARMLLFHLYIREDESSQQVARAVQGGFHVQSWMALLRSGQVYDARITALKHPEKDHFSSILLSTTYDGSPNTYHQFFWEKLSFFFVSLALAAREPPFKPSDLTESQAKAFGACQAALQSSDVDAFQAAISRLSDALSEDDQRKRDKIITKTKFELFSDFVNRNDLLYRVGSPAEPGAAASHDLRVPPAVNERSNFLNPSILEGPFPVASPERDRTRWP